MDAVIKIGGSLAKDAAMLRRCCNRISEIGKKYSATVVPGGGMFADAVRQIDQQYRLSPEISHRMAILGMDQFGLFLSQIIPHSCATYLIDDVMQLSKIAVVPIFLPSRLMFRENALEPSWNVTSDSITAYIASRLKANKVILVTDVDGIFSSDPKRHPHAKLIPALSAAELLHLTRRTSVDQFLPKLLLKIQLDCYVVNGAHPERIEAILDGQDTVCTLVKSQNK